MRTQTISTTQLRAILEAQIQKATVISFIALTTPADVFAELTRPSAVLRLALVKDGNQWYVLYGDNLQEGIAGFGDTPDKAMRAFDVAWHSEKAARTNETHATTQS